jgi:hypothetical protein
VLKAVTIMERVLLDQLSDAEESKTRPGLQTPLERMILLPRAVTQEGRVGHVARTQLDAMWFFIVYALVDQQTFVTSSCFCE